MTALATMGHNKPPSELELLKERLEDKYEDEVFEWENLSDQKIPEVLETQDDAGKLNEFVGAIKAFKSKVEKIHTTEKKPFLDGGRLVDQWKNDFVSKIDALINNAKIPMDAFLKKKAEDERIRQAAIAEKDRVEAARLAEEAKAHEDAGIHDTAQELMETANSKIVLAERIEDGKYLAPQKTRSNLGFTSSQTKKWAVEITALELVDLEKCRPYFTEAEILKALRGAVRNGARQITGANIFEETDVKFR